VPWGKYRELQREHQTAAQQAQQYREENERLKRALTGAPDPTPAKPEWDNDPLTWSKEQIDRLAESNQALAGQIQEMQFINAVTQQEQQYASQHQEYLEARDAAIATRRTYWNLIYPNNPQGAEQMVDAERRLVMQAALQSGRSVPELVMELAPHFGWKAKGAVPPAPNGNGPTAPAPARVAQMRAAAQVAATSVASVPGAAGSKAGVITREQLLAMSQAEMDAMETEEPGWLERLDA
jgi:FtsZ-binding cell division protein ZapB